MGRKVLLVTGATGNVGALLRPILRTQYDLVLTGRRDLEPAYGEIYTPGDLCDPQFVDRITSRVDGIVHLAGAVGNSLSFNDTLGPNYTSLLLLLEACRRKSIQRFIFASSHHIIGMLPSSQTWDENAPLAPDGFYGLSKAFGEAACSMYSHRFGIRSLVIRIGNADPQIVDGRRERIWISGADLASLVVEGMEAPELGFEIVNGVSNSDRPLLSRRPSSQVRYDAQDHSSNHHSASFRPLDMLGDADGVLFVGGLFAAGSLVAPFEGD